MLRPASTTCCFRRATWLYEREGLLDHPNCLDNFIAAAAAVGVSLPVVPDPVNVFQNSDPAPDGTLNVDTAASRGSGSSSSRSAWHDATASGPASAAAPSVLARVATRSTRQPPKRKDLTLILGIGRDCAPVLEDLDVATWEDLLHSDVQALAASFRARGYPTVTAMEIWRWRQHARSYALGHPVPFNDLATSAAADFPIGRSFIALDLEYD
jgi:predicted flap endonuclease-1-like 5' DNA nuclease